MDINKIIDSFTLQKELTKESYDQFIAMKHNLFKRKATLEMVALKNSIPSPWQEGQLAFKGDHMGVIKSEESKVL